MTLVGLCMAVFYAFLRGTQRSGLARIRQNVLNSGYHWKDANALDSTAIISQETYPSSQGSFGISLADGLAHGSNCSNFPMISPKHDISSLVRIGTSTTIEIQFFQPLLQARHWMFIRQITPFAHLVVLVLPSSRYIITCHFPHLTNENCRSYHKGIERRLIDKKFEELSSFINQLSGIEAWLLPLTIHPTLHRSTR